MLPDAEPRFFENKKDTRFFILHRIIAEVYYMNSCALTASVTAVANLLASKLNNDELTLLASVLVQLGDTLVTIATQKAICENISNK